VRPFFFRWAAARVRDSDARARSGLKGNEKTYDRSFALRRARTKSARKPRRIRYNHVFRARLTGDGRPRTPSPPSTDTSGACMSLPVSYYRR